MGMIWNIFGLALVILFVNLVDWSLWVSIPVGILISAFVVLLLSYVIAATKAR